MDIAEKFRVVEFCAGYGGICLGLRRAIPNLRVIAVSEIEGFAAANLVAKMEAGLMDPAPVWPDLKTFPSKQFHGLVDILVAGFPCQPFSAAGNRNADDDPRHLFPYIKQSIIDMQPTFVFLENVEGIISAKLKSDDWSDEAGTAVLLHVLRELERVGYTATAGIFSAEEVGAPHRRKRVFILAKLPDAGLLPRCTGQEQQQDERPEKSTGSGKLAYRISEGLEGHARDVYDEGRKGGRQDASTSCRGRCITMALSPWRATARMGTAKSRRAN